jgi:hypothetical protein
MILLKQSARSGRLQIKVIDPPDQMEQALETPAEVRERMRCGGSQGNASRGAATWLDPRILSPDRVTNNPKLPALLLIAASQCTMRRMPRLCHLRIQDWIHGALRACSDSGRSAITILRRKGASHEDPPFLD